MARFLALLVVVVCFHSQRISSQDFRTNLEGLNIIDLNNIEEQLLPSINMYINDKEKTLEELEYIFNQTSATADSQAKQTSEEYLANPLNQYLVIKRFSESWGKLSEFLYSDSSVDGKFGGKVKRYCQCTS